MAKIQIAGNIASITMEKDAKVVDRVNKYCPEAMEIRDEGGNVTFKLSVGKNDSFSQYGASFKSVSNATGKYSAAVRIENEVADPKADIVERYGKMIANLNWIEEQIEACAEEAASKERAINNAVEIVG